MASCAPKQEVSQQNTDDNRHAYGFFLLVSILDNMCETRTNREALHMKLLVR